MGLDSRGYHNYVLGAGSIVGTRRYTVATDNCLAPCPAGIRAKLSTPDKRQRDDTPLIDWDRPSSIEIARRVAAQAEPSVEGAGGNNRAFQVAAQIRDYAVSEIECLQIMLDVFNPRCSPEWDHDEMKAIVEHVYDYAKNQPGVAHPDAIFAEVQIDPETHRPFTEPGRPVAIPFVWRDPASIPQRRWLYGTGLIIGYLSLTIAPGGVGKSTITIAEALAVATGRPLLGVTPHTTAPVLIMSLEDPAEELERRILAQAVAFGIQPDELDGRLYVRAADDGPFVLAAQDHDGLKIDERCISEVCDFIRDKGIKLLTVDPFVSAHRLPENDNGAIDALVKALTRLAQRAECAVELVHHTRKGSGHDLGVDDGRGASAVVAAARHVRIFQKMTKEEAQKLGVPEGEAFRYVRINSGKQNMAPPISAASWVRLMSCQLPNGDSVQVPAAWTPPCPTTNVTDVDLERVQAAIAARQPNGEPWRMSAQAKERWGGIAIADVLDLDLARPNDVHRTKELIKAWTRDGTLKQGSWRDSKGRDVPTLESSPGFRP